MLRTASGLLPMSAQPPRPLSGRLAFSRRGLYAVRTNDRSHGRAMFLKPIEHRG